MADKLSWTDLRKLLATRAGVSEKTAGTFLNALTAQLLQGLKSDKMVKINGLGTFKLQAVAPRKSVNVSTGEEITIEGYNKVVFSPEAGVKELVEKGPVKEAIDPLKKLGEQATEIVDLLADLGQSPQQETKKKRAPKKAKEPIAEPVVEEKAKPYVYTEPEAKPEPKKQGHHFLRDLLICVVILLMLTIGGYFFLRSQISNWLESLTKPQPATIEQVDEPVVETPAVTDTVASETQQAMDLIPEGEIPQQQILDEFMAISGELEPEKDEPYPNLITTEAMHEGSRLTWMAKRFYGHKIYWPYLYDANRDHITNPCNIEVGTPIRVPRLTPEQLDTANTETRANLERLRIEAEEACRK